MVAATHQSPSFLALLAAVSCERALAKDFNPICDRSVYTQTGVVNIVPADTFRLAPFAPTTAAGRPRLPSVEDVFKFFAEGTNETPPPSSVYCVAQDLPHSSQLSTSSATDPTLTPISILRASEDPGSRQLPPLPGLPCGPPMRSTPSACLIKRETPELSQSPGPIRTPRPHFAPTVADYGRPTIVMPKEEATDAPIERPKLVAKLSKQTVITNAKSKVGKHTTTKRRGKKADSNVPPPLAIKAIQTEENKMFIPEWPWDFYACDIKEGLERYDALVQQRMPVVERQRLIAEIFDEAHPLFAGAFKAWRERLNEPRASELLEEFAKLGRVEKGTFIEYDRVRRGNTYFNISRLSSGYRVLRGSKDFHRRENRLRGCVELKSEDTEPEPLRPLADETKPILPIRFLSPRTPRHMILNETVRHEMMGTAEHPILVA